MSDAYDKYLTFTLDEDFFALDISSVREVQDYTEITRIPESLPHMRGVVNLRGSAVPVLDIKMKFGMRRTEQTINTRIIIMTIERSGKEQLVGMLADSVKEVLEIGAKDIAPAPRMGTRVHVDNILGVSRKDDRFILILDLDRIISTKELLDEECAKTDPACQPDEAPAEEAGPTEQAQEDDKGE